MTNRQFYDWQTDGGAGDVLHMVNLLESRELPWCMIGGLAVNNWADEPMVTKDVDLVIALDRVDDALEVLKTGGYLVKEFPYSVNLTGDSKVSIQISTDEIYREFPARSVPADIHGILMRVASAEDTLTGKLLAYADKTRRPSKRQKDLTDIFRLVEANPHLEAMLPQTIRDKMNEL